MAKRNSFKLMEILKEKPNQYLLVFEMNGQKKEIIARISMETPIFGVNFSDEFTLMMRNAPQENRRLVKIIKSYHFGSEVNFPVVFVPESNIPELQAA